MTHRIKRATAFVANGSASRAASTLASNSSISFDQKSIAELNRLHPRRTQPLPPLPRSAPKIILQAEHLTKIVKQNLANKSAPGPSGWTGEHIATLMGDEECREAVTVIVSMIVNGQFDDVARARYLACRLMPFAKPGGGVRPVAIPDAWYKLAAIVVNKRVLCNREKIFPSIQMAVGLPGGAERAVHTVRAALELNPSHVAISTDITNAFNSCSRQAMATALYKNPATKDAWRLFDSAYNTESQLLVYNDGKRVAKLASTQGSRQGDPIGGTAFAIAVQPAFEACLSVARAHANSTATAIMDDFCLVTDRKAVEKALLELKKQLEQISLSLNLAKCRVLWPKSAGPIPPDFAAMCRRLGVQVVRGSMEIVGAMVGDDDDAVVKHCKSILDEHLPFFEALQHPQLHSQHAMEILRMSAAPRLNYISRVTYPHLLRRAAATFDQHVLVTLAKILDLPNISHFHPPAMEQIFKPRKYGGIGLRQVTRYLDIAFLSSYAQALPDIATVVQQTRQVRSNVTIDMSRSHSLARSCHADIVKLGVPNTEFFSTNSSTFFNTYQRNPAIKLQHNISAIIDEQRHKASLDLSKNAEHDVARLRSLEAPRARTWLTTPPTQHEYVMHKDSFKIALRHALNIDPINSMPPTCRCGKPLGRNTTPSISDPTRATHLLTCVHREKTSRHDHVVNTLAKLARTAGMQTVVEPTVTTYRDFKAQNSCPDLWIWTPQAAFLVDVRVMHPCAPSYVKANSTKAQRTLDKEAKDKHNSYDNLAQSKNATFIPFLMDAYGSLHHEAVKLIHIISETAYQNSNRQNKNFKLHAFRTIAFALQHVNVTTINSQAESSRADDHQRNRHRDRE